MEHQSKPTASDECVPSFLNETGANSPFPLCKNPSDDCLSGECQTQSHAKGDNRESLHERSEFHCQFQTGETMKSQQFSGQKFASKNRTKIRPRFCQKTRPVRAVFARKDPQKSGEDRAKSGEDNFDMYPRALFRPQIQPENLIEWPWCGEDWARQGECATQSWETLRTRGTELNSGVPQDFKTARRYLFGPH